MTTAVQTTPITAHVSFRDTGGVIQMDQIAEVLGDMTALLAGLSTSHLDLLGKPELVDAMGNRRFEVVRLTYASPLELILANLPEIATGISLDATVLIALPRAVRNFSKLRVDIARHNLELRELKREELLAARRAIRLASGERDLSWALDRTDIKALRELEARQLQALRSIERAVTKAGDEVHDSSDLD